MNKIILAAAFAASLGMTGAVSAQETLIFATTNPEQHPMNEGFFKPWVEKINAEAPDAVQIDMRHGPMIANHTNFYDRVVDNVTQIGWGMTVFNPGKFPRSLVSTLPFLVDSSEQGSVALCRMYEKGAFDQEMGDIKPLLFVEFPQASLHLNGSEIGGIDDLAGKKVITSSPAAAAIVGAYGGTPLSFNITEQYESLQRGAADGTILNFTALPGFRLNEVLTHSYVAPLGGAMGMIFMSREKWDSLSDEARAAIEKHSGCEVTRAFGAFVDGWEAGATGMVKSNGMTVVTASDEEVNAIAQKMAPGIEAGFAERVPGGSELIEMFKTELDAANN